jgi:hypothetical protein
MRRVARGVAALAVALLPATALLALHFRDGPPARVTGGFGEDSCIACHDGNALNDPAGRLKLDGFPEHYQPGAIFELTLELSRPALAAAGFQLAIRHADDNAQAGTLELPAGDAARIGLLHEGGLQFAQHRDAALGEPAGETARWTLRWTAPEAGGEIVLNAAAVAGNGDESQAGDHVYTLQFKGVASP